MARAIDLDASESYLKYTVALAGVGFAFAQTRLGTIETLYGLDKVGFLPLPETPLVLLLLLFFISSVVGIFAISAIVGIRNDAAGFMALSPNRRHARLDAHTEKRALRMASARGLANTHLWALIVGFCVAMAVFLGEVMNPAPKDPPLCQSRLWQAHVTYPCGASLQDIFENGRVTP